MSLIPEYPHLTRAILGRNMQLACKLALLSTDQSSQVGAVIIGARGEYISTGANILSAGIPETDENHARPRKYAVRNHAESLAVIHAARHGNATNGAVMISPWAACTMCARVIVAAGIHSLVRLPFDPTNDHWSADIQLGDDILHTGGVAIVEDRFDEIELPQILRNGSYINPRG